MSTDEAAAVFASLLRQHRLAAGLTQEDLAERAGLSTRGISDLERGIKRPRMDTVALLVRALPFDDAARTAFERASRRARLLPVEQVAPVRTAAPADLPAGGYLGAVPSFPLVARHKELAQVLTALEAGRPGGTRLLVLAGEPGVGKTRLAQEVLLQVRATGWLTLVGRCYEEHQRTPYFPFRQVLVTAWDAAAPTLRERASERFAALGRLLPEVLPEPPAAEDEEARLRLLGAVAGFLESLATGQPLLVLLDDLHWADQASLDVLRHLVRFAHGVRVLGTYRDVEVGRRHPLEQVLSELLREQLVDPFPILPLTAEGTTALIAAQVGLDDVTIEQREAIHRHAAGNPFFTTELVAVLLEQSAVPRAAAAGSSRAAPQLLLPESVRAVVEQRVGRLAPAAQELLRLASVLGQEFDLELLLAASDQGEETVLAQVDAALAARLLEERRVGDRDRLAFSHALIAQVLYEAMPRYRLRRLHVRVAGALERLRSADAEAAGELGRHFLAGGEPEQAVEYLERAGDLARAQQGREAAEGFYREAVQGLDHLRRPLDAARLREKLGMVLGNAARYAEALAILEPAAETYRAAGDLEATGRVVAHLASLIGALGRPGDGLARLESILTLLAPRGASPALGSLYLVQAGALGLLGRSAEQLAAVDASEQVCRLVGDDVLLASVLHMRGYASVGLWRLSEAIQALTEGSEVAEAAGDFCAQCSGLLSLGHAYQEAGSLAAGRQVRARAVQVAEQYGYPIAQAVGTTALGWQDFLDGDWHAARVKLDRAITLYQEIGPGVYDYLAQHNLGTVCLAEGSDAEAALHLDASERLWQAGQVAQTHINFALLRILAERDLLAGRPQEARSRLIHVLDGLAPQAVERLPLLHLMAWALLDMDEVKAAAKVATEAVTTARDVGARLLMVDTLRVAVQVEMRQRRWEAAESSLEEGLLLAQDMGYPYGEARLLLVAGEVYAQMAQPEKARERLEAALIIARRLGARRVVAQAEQLISAIG